MKKELKKLIELYPTQGIFADKVGIDETALSRILKDERDVPKNLIESIMLYTGWKFDDLFVIEEK